MRMGDTNNKKGWPTWAVLLSGLLAIGGLAGCIDAIEQDAANEAPTAKLASDRPSAFAGEDFEFDATGSSDPDGNITAYRFDFGDNQSLEVKRQDDAMVRHAYERGGEYVVTVTVIDDGGQGEGAASDTATLRVAVNENHTIPSQVLLAGPGNATTAAQYSQAFLAHEGVDRFELNVTLQSLLATGSSEITIKVLDSDNETVAEDSVTLSAGEGQEVVLEGALGAAGDYLVVIEAESGAATAAGELLVLYDDGF